MLLKIVPIIILFIIINPAIKADIAVKDELIPRKALFTLPKKRQELNFSPDGKYISYIAEKDNKAYIYIVDSEDPDNIITTIDIKDARCNYAWGYDNSHIFYLEKDKSTNNNKLYSYDIQTKQTKLLTPDKDVTTQLIATSPKNPNKILIGLKQDNQQLFDVYSFSLVNDSKQLVLNNSDNKFWNFLADDNLQICFGMKYNEKGKKEYWRFIDNKWQPFTKIPLKDSYDTRFFNCNSQNNSTYLYDSRDRDNVAIKFLDLKNGKSELIAEDGKSDSYSFTSDPITNKVQAVITNYDKPKYHIIDNAIRDDIKFLESLNLGELEIINRTIDDQIWFVLFYSDISPTKYYKYDRKNKKVKYLFARYKALEQYSLASMSSVIIKSRDGLDLVSYLTLPNNIGLSNKIYPKKPLPLVLLVHDGPDQRDKWGMNIKHQWLANRGYAVLSVNFRGSEGFGKKFLSSGYGEWGRGMQDDLTDAVNWAIKNKIAAPKKIAIMGFGYGGYATLAGLTFTPELFVCGVDVSGPSNLATISNYFIQDSRLDRIDKVKFSLLETAENKEKLYQYSPLMHIASITKPLLIIQGTEDIRVPQTETDKMVDALIKHSKPVIYALYKDEGGSFRNESNTISFYAIAERFLAKHLGGRFEEFEDEVLSNPNLLLNGQAPSENLLVDLLNR